MRCTNSLSLAGLFWVVVSGSAFGDTAMRFDYVASQFPSDGRACADVAAEIGRAFEAQTGITARRVACESDIGPTFDVRLTFFAETPPPGASTFIEVAPALSAAAFATKADCDAALAPGTARFTSLTGLTPLVAYCYQEFETELYPWAQRIDAFGTPRLFPSYDGGILIAQPVGLDEAGLQAVIAEGLEGQGFDVSFVAVRFDGSASWVTVQAFGDRELSSGFEIVAATQTLEQCNEQLARLRSFFPADAGYVTSFCTYRDSLGLFEVVTAALGLRWNVDRSQERFASYAECSAQVDDVAGLYPSTAERRVLGGACGYHALDHYWSVKLLTQYTEQ